MNLFDILGPVMVGPSSSHTAGAVRIGYVASRLLQDKPLQAQIFLHGSFATTGVGHGTDRALIAGLLGMKPDDMRIPESFEIAGREGLTFSFSARNIKDAHPNTALLKLTGREGRYVEVQGASIGGGRIKVQKIDGLDVNVTAEKPTLIVHNIDRPGYVAGVTSMLAGKDVNVATLELYRNKRGGYAVMVVVTDQPVPRDVPARLGRMEGILRVTCLEGGL